MRWRLKQAFEPCGKLTDKIALRIEPADRRAGDVAPSVYDDDGGKLVHSEAARNRTFGVA